MLPLLPPLHETPETIPESEILQQLITVVVAAERPVHPLPSVTVTVYVPAEPTEMVWEEAVVDQL